MLTPALKFLNFLIIRNDRDRDLRGHTESEIIAAEDLALQTKYHATKLLHTETQSKG
jgi:hypothetical protein